MQNFEYNYFDEGIDPRQNERSTVKFNETNYLNTRLNDNENSKQVRIRIILTKDPVDGREKFAIPVSVHSVKLNEKQRQLSKSGFKSFLCLNDKHIQKEGEECPFCQESQNLFAIGNNTEDPVERKSIAREAYSLKPKTAYIARCIDRDHEDEGVKFWRFNSKSDGTGVFDVIKSLFMQRNNEAVLDGEEPYSIFDYENGRDLIINITRSKSDKPNMRDKMGISISDYGRPTPLSKDKEKAEAWINDPKDWKDMYRVKSQDYLSIVASGEMPVFDSFIGKYVPKKIEEEPIEHDVIDVIAEDGEPSAGDSLPF